MRTLRLDNIPQVLLTPTQENNPLRQTAALSLLALLTLPACDRPADVADRNLRQAADSFEVNRRITFINTRGGAALLVIEGLCALGNNDTTQRMSVTCKTGPDTFKRHSVGLSSEVTYVAEQIESNQASIYRYRVTFNPTTIIPDLRAP